MVKFFLKNQAHPPKSNQVQKNKDKSKQKPKKVLDYRILIWKKLFNLIKTEHALIIQKIIRKIKETKQKISLRQTQPNQPDIEAKIAFLNKDLTSFDTKYQSIKSIKKPELKRITLYIILEVLKIDNISKIIQKAKLDKNLQTQTLKQQLQNNDSVKKFIEKLSLLTVYQKELESCAQLVDIVQQKKLQRKTKLKQRKQRKYQRQHEVKTQKDLQEEADPQNSQNSNPDNQSSHEKSSQDQPHKKNTLQTTKKIQRVEYKHYRNQHYKTNHDNKSLNYKERQQPKKFQKQKPIHKQRTQFRKTGRNKVKYEKQQKKNHFKNKGKQQTSNPPAQQTPKRKGQFSFSKQQAHPSWKAKQQLKRQVYIQPFQGKKILL